MMIKIMMVFIVNEDERNKDINDNKNTEITVIITFSREVVIILRKLMMIIVTVSKKKKWR